MRKLLETVEKKLLRKRKSGKRKGKNGKSSWMKSWLQIGRKDNNKERRKAVSQSSKAIKPKKATRMKMRNKNKPSARDKLG